MDRTEEKSNFNDEIYYTDNIIIVITAIAVIVALLLLLYKRIYTFVVQFEVPKIHSISMIHSNALCFVFANAHHSHWSDEKETADTENKIFKQNDMKTCVSIVCVYVLFLK